MANTFRNKFYSPIKVLAYVVMAGLGGIGLISALYALMSFYMIVSPDSTMHLGNGATVPFGLGIIGLASAFEVPIRLATVILFLIWEYRAFGNLSALKARNLEFSPGWSVGWWFIPFANLVKPFQVVRELYNESNPNFDDETGYLNISPGTPEIVGFWWAVFIISNIIFRVSDMLVDPRTGMLSEYFSIVFMTAAILHTAAAILAIYIVKIVTERQTQRLARIEQNTQSAPPPPPIFDKTE